MLFVVFILLAVVVSIYLTGRWSWMTGQHLTVHFRNVEGLTEGAEVLLAGMTVGRVLTIELATQEEQKRFPERPIVVRLAIDKGVQLLDTDRFVVTQSGLLGDTHIAVRRKTEEERKAEAELLRIPLKVSKPLHDGADISGEKAVGLTELGNDAQAVLQQVQGALADLREVYAGPEMQRQLPLILGNVERATSHALEFSEALARISLQNEGKISTIAGEIASASGAINQSAQRVQQMIAAGAPDIEGATARVAQMVDATAQNVETATQHLAKTGARLEGMTEASAGDIERTTARIESMAARTAENIETTSSTIEEATRAAGADLTATAKRVRELVDGSSGNIERAAAEVEKATTAMAALVEESGKDITAGAKRASEMIARTAADVEKASAELAGMSETLHADLSAASGRARTMVERSSDDIERTTRRIHDLLATSPLPTDLAAAGAHIRKSAENIEQVTQSVRATMTDGELMAHIEATVANLDKAGSHLVAMTEEGALLVAEGRQAVAKATGLATDEEMWEGIRGTVDQLNQAMDDIAAITAHGKEVVTDPEFTEDLTQSVANIRAFTDQGIQVAEKADRSLARVDETMDNVQDLSRSLRPSYIPGYASLEGIDGFGLRADLVADLYFGASGRGFWRAGIRDVGDAESLILQRGVWLDPGTAVRLGIMGNELGVGIDYALGRRLSLEFDAWEPDDPRLDGRAVWGLNDDWSISFGANEIGGGFSPFLGLRRDLLYGGSRPQPPRAKSVATPGKPEAPPAP